MPFKAVFGGLHFLKKLKNIGFNDAFKPDTDIEIKNAYGI